jgi:hypothetical protein
VSVTQRYIGACYSLWVGQWRVGEGDNFAVKGPLIAKSSALARLRFHYLLRQLLSEVAMSDGFLLSLAQRRECR